MVYVVMAYAVMAALLEQVDTRVAYRRSVCIGIADGMPGARLCVGRTPSGRLDASFPDGTVARTSRAGACAYVRAHLDITRAAISAIGPNYVCVCVCIYKLYRP